MKTKQIYGIALVVIAIALATAAYVFNISETTAINTMEVIPEMPEDFTAFKRDIQAGQLIELCNVDETYWRQPEFYKSWENGKAKFYNNPDYSRWGVHGHGASPTEIGYEVEAMKKGDSFEVCSFFHNGWGIWTYQGFHLVPIDNEFFDVEITPSDFLVEPTFPVFEQNWVYKIRMKVTAKKDVPEGTYNLGYDVSTPDSSDSRTWTKEVLAREYANKEEYKSECVKLLKDKEKCNFLIDMREKKYVDGGGYKASEQVFKLVVVVK